MLRHKLILFLGVVVVLLVASVAASIWQLGDALADQGELTARFRWTVIALGLVFLVVINISIIVLLHTAKMVVDPVEKLTAASRALAAGHLDTRVHVDQHDEFDELAASFNHLAEELESTEQRRLDILKQVGVTLSHELNNASAIIELQLGVLGRRGGATPAQARALKQIHESLQRMTRTVKELGQVRRIVLTNYTADSDTQMLDLKRSIQVDADPRLAHGAHN